ncbi:hypothetical protein [Paraburkholderia susongensis]|uniref:YMGG-like Gly-zipper n=1 Tax=Paraburkholderia susongensis TaxID=1515439 RepID=A0A1X7M5X0_9BURK|nr:hypothetical protein [Paraburkholderia susongensis]SMG61495.1 hypothetical protein SAMN06265784_12254 [Paraburkholderia susongensis]
MKVRVLMVAASAVLFLAPRTANAAEPDAGMSGRALMQQNADESAQATTDMSFGRGWQAQQDRDQAMRDVSYGGVSDGQSEAGNRRSRSCAFGPQCKVYFGQ